MGISAELDPQVPHASHTFWAWATFNAIVPIVGVLFFDWNIFSVVSLFWIEIFLWGCIGLLKILTANGAPGLILKITTRIGSLLFFGVLYFFGIFLLLFSFVFVEIDTETMLSGTTGVYGAGIFIAINYLIEFIRSELLTGKWRTRLPMEVVFERIIYALPLTCLVLFAVLPLSKRFDGENIEKVIAIGVVAAKFIIDVVAHYLPGFTLVSDADGAENLDEPTENG
ncbi:MAG: hypothetical protein KDD32_08695 [Bacteroidetes bacterium]|nr:hypothetical protein [Bacteroidota bacterium]